MFNKTQVEIENKWQHKVNFFFFNCFFTYIKMRKNFCVLQDKYIKKKAYPCQSENCVNRKVTLNLSEDLVDTMLDTLEVTSQNTNPPKQNKQT